MDVPEIKDREHLEAWLNTRSREECVAIAHRAAMREAPLWMGRARFKAKFRSKGLTEIVFFRPLLISGVAMVFPAAAMRQAVTASTNYEITELLANPSNATFLSATDAFSAAYAAAAEHVAAAAFNAADSFFSAIYSRKEVVSLDNWKLIWNDLDAIQTGARPFAMPLYQEYADPLPWARARADLVKRGKDWDFWVRWYDAALRGQPLNWKMQEEIALLPSDVWEGDVAGLAAAIAVIEDKHSLLDQIAALKAKLIEAKAQDQMFDSTLAHRWHNNPPELLDTVVEMRDQFTLVLDAIDNAENELNLPNPDPSVLRVIGNFLLDAGKSMLVYSASLADVMLKRAAEEIGSTGTKVFIVSVASYFLAQAEPIQSIGKSMLELAVKLASGG